MDTLAPSVESKVVSRWWLFFTLAAIVAGISASLAYRGDFSVEAIRHVIRVTAQMSLVLFLSALAASSLLFFWPNTLFRFMVAGRRQIGLAFAFSHAVHALALLAFSRIDPVGFDRATDPAMFLFGGFAYLFIVAMAVTSFDGAVTLLGPRNWRRLHLVGGSIIWLTFLVAEGKRAVHDTYYWPFVVLLLVAMTLRLAKRLARRT